MNNVSDKAQVLDGPEAVAASMQRMMQLSNPQLLPQLPSRPVKLDRLIFLQKMQDERAKQIKLLQERFQVALAEERARSEARFRERWQRLQRHKTQYIKSLLFSIEERRRLEARMKVVEKNALRMKELEEVLREGYHGRATEAHSSLAER